MTSNFSAGIPFIFVNGCSSPSIILEGGSCFATNGTIKIDNEYISYRSIYGSTLQNITSVVADTKKHDDFSIGSTNNNITIGSANDPTIMLITGDFISAASKKNMFTLMYGLLYVHGHLAFGEGAVE